MHDTCNIKACLPDVRQKFVFECSAYCLFTRGIDLWSISITTIPIVFYIGYIEVGYRNVLRAIYTSNLFIAAALPTTHKENKVKDRH